MKKELDLHELEFEADRMNTLLSYQYDLFNRISKDVIELAKTSSNQNTCKKITENMNAISVLYVDIFDISNAIVIPAINQLIAEDEAETLVKS